MDLINTGSLHVKYFLNDCNYFFRLSSIFAKKIVEAPKASSHHSLVSISWKLFIFSIFGLFVRIKYFIFYDYVDKFISYFQ